MRRRGEGRRGGDGTAGHECISTIEKLLSRFSPALLRSIYLPFTVLASWCLVCGSVGVVSGAGIILMEGEEEGEGGVKFVCFVLFSNLKDKRSVWNRRGRTAGILFFFRSNHLPIF